MTGRNRSFSKEGEIYFFKDTGLFCSINISLLASLVAVRRPLCNAGADQQGMYSTKPIHWTIKSAPASPGRSRVGLALYVFSLLGNNCLKNGLQTIHIIAQGIAQRYLTSYISLYVRQIKRNFFVFCIYGKVTTSKMCNLLTEMYVTVS